MSLQYRPLADHPEHISLCAEWAFGAWGGYNPVITMQKRLEAFTKHCNRDVIPITWLAMEAENPVGMVSLRNNDGVREDLSPWLGSLYVTEQARRCGVGRALVDIVKKNARLLGFAEVYLLTYEASLPAWYASLGWQEIAKDTLNSNPITVMKHLLP